MAAPFFLLYSYRISDLRGETGRFWRFIFGMESAGWGKFGSKGGLTRILEDAELAHDSSRNGKIRVRSGWQKVNKRVADLVEMTRLNTIFDLQARSESRWGPSREAGRLAKHSNKGVSRADPFHKLHSFRESLDETFSRAHP